MSSISALSSAIQHSPKQRILDSISAGVSAGSISKTDQTALDGAVGDIDSSLTSSSTSSTSSRPDPSDIKAKIDSLIDNEVTSGKLTSDQASTLKQVFSQNGGRHAHGAGGPGGPGGAGGPPPGPPPSGSPDDSASSSDPTSSSASTSDLLASFLKELQSSQSTASGYGETGTSSPGSTSNSLLFNFAA